MFGNFYRYGVPDSDIRACSGLAAIHFMKNLWEGTYNP
jgi:hypothetical protein